MTIKNINLYALFLISFTGCADVSESLDEGGVEEQQEINVEESNVEESNETPVSNRRLETSSNQEGPVSCQKECGMEARGTIFTECLDAGGEKNDCGRDARIWYRDCLHSRCTDNQEEESTEEQ